MLPAWQGAGRFDIPGRAITLYLAESPQAAVGETFGKMAYWNDAMFLSGITGLRRSLVTFEADPADLGVVELDDAAFLASRNYRQSDIVARNRGRTQEIALELWLDGVRALRWWSYYRPEWRVVSVWADEADPQPWKDIVRPVNAEDLHINHNAVVVASEVISRVRQS